MEPTLNPGFVTEAEYRSAKIPGNVLPHGNWKMVFLYKGTNLEDDFNSHKQRIRDDSNG